MAAQHRTDRTGRPLSPDALDDLVARMARHRVVLMGEATHGTSEFYALRAALTLRLVREHGFDFVAVEGDWPDCFQVNRWIKGDPEPPRDVHQMLAAFSRWPTWMWANHDVAALATALRAHNEAAPRKVGFYGLDVYSLWDSLHAALRHLARIGSDAQRAARAAIDCFEPYATDPHEYARRAAWVPDACRVELVALLAATRAEFGALPDHATEAQLDAEQNALVAHNAERYYQAWARGGPDGWNVRDRHMTQTLDRLLAHHDDERRPAKGIVWAHNTHVGDARATDMARDGLVNIGQLAREAYGEDAFLLGLSAYSGSVLAGRAWEAPVQTMRLPPARAGSLEARLHGAGGDRLLLLPEDDPSPDVVGHRAVGVVYAPEHEAGNYVPTRLRDRYDALVHIDHTRALRPLGVAAEPVEVPETWPWGV